MILNWNHPSVSEYPPYYEKYIQKVPPGNLIHFLENSTNEFVEFLNNITEEKLSYRYAENKWTIPQIVQHLIDAERIFTYRALRFARKDQTELPGFEENDYANEATGEDRSFNEILEEYKSVRNSTLMLFQSFNDEILERKGSANNNMISVRSIIFIIAGHSEHHLQIIKERYLTEMRNSKLPTFL